MIMQPIRAWSLKFVMMLCANKPLRNVREPLRTLREAEGTFFAKYRTYHSVHISLIVI